MIYALRITVFIGYGQGRDLYPSPAFAFSCRKKKFTAVVEKIHTSTRYV